LPKSGITRSYLLIKASPHDTSFLSLQIQESDRQLTGSRRDSALVTASVLEEICSGWRG